VNGENFLRAPLAAAQIDFLGITPSSEPILPGLQSQLSPIIDYEYSGALQPQAISVDPINLQANQQARSIIGIDQLNSDPRFANIHGQSWTIAVIDTGINPQHSFFGADVDGNGIADRIIYQYDFADGDANARDVNGHGSQTTSIVASQDGILPGIAPAVNIISLKVFNDSGESDYRYVKRALDWVNANADRYRIATVLMALGDNRSSEAINSQYQLGQTLAELADRGIIPVASAGNNYFHLNGQFGLSSPANDPSVISAGAVYNANLGRQEYASNAVAYSSDIDRVAAFSQRAPQTLFAPGAAITGAGATGNSLLTLQGTSQAAAYVAGAAVIAQQLATKYLGHSLTGAEFQQLALATAVEIKDGDNEDDNVINTGASFRRLDLWALANKIWDLRSDVSQTQLSITSNQNLAWESGQAGSFTATRTGDLSNNLSFNYRLAGTADNSIDYQALSGTANFLAGQSTTQITVTAIDDLIAESGETVKISLAIGSGYQLTKQYQASLAIVDNDSIIYEASALDSTSVVNKFLFPVSEEINLQIVSPVVIRSIETVRSLFALFSSTSLTTIVKTIDLQNKLITSITIEEVEPVRSAQPTETFTIAIDLDTQYAIQDMNLANDWLPTGLLSR
jgi:Subtilase family/Calx-beta domain